MNIELKPIAESKVRQLGGDVCGVLVRNQAGRLAAVDEHGRFTWLSDDGPGPVELSGAEIESIKQRADAWLGLVELLNDLTPEWRQRPGTGRESAFAAIRGLAQAARAQGGQGAEVVACPLCKYERGHQIGCENNPVDMALRSSAQPVAEIVHDYNGVSVQWLEPAKYGRFQSGQKLYTQPQPAVPEVLALCSECHQEFSVPLESGGNATTDLLCNFCNCPHCGERVDLWIKLASPATPQSATPSVPVSVITPEIVDWVRCGIAANNRHKEKEAVDAFHRFNDAVLKASEAMNNDAPTTPQADGWNWCADRVHAKCGGRVVGRMRDGDSVSCEKCGRSGHVLIDDGGIDIDWTPAGQEDA